ncbi:MAG TPA: GNAT family protein [Candidatus Acidoferrales bacterium]|nr:GNAT family protein [Candidatus Acidoferrales bacterium]
METLIVPPSGSETGGKLPLPIATPRLSLRPIRPEDLADWLEYVTDEESYRHTSQYAPNAEEAGSWLENGQTVRLTQPNGRLTLGIELQNDARMIGHLTLNLTDPEEHVQGSFNIMIHPAHRRQGYGTEAVLGLLGFGFDGIALHDIRVSIDIRNLAGRRMVEKAGLKLEGEFVEQWRLKGEWSSTAYYVMLAKWWRAATSL